jgi:hypothetical protein
MTANRRAWTLARSSLPKHTVCRYSNGQSSYCASACFSWSIKSDNFHPALILFQIDCSSVFKSRHSICNESLLLSSVAATCDKRGHALADSRLLLWILLRQFFGRTQINKQPFLLCFSPPQSSTPTYNIWMLAHHASASHSSTILSFPTHSSPYRYQSLQPLLWARTVMSASSTLGALPDTCRIISSPRNPRSQTPWWWDQARRLFCGRERYISLLFSHSCKSLFNALVTWLY